MKNLENHSTFRTGIISCSLACILFSPGLHAQKGKGGGGTGGGETEYLYTLTVLQPPSGARMGRAVNLDNAGTAVGWSFFSERNPSGGWREVMVGCAWNPSAGQITVLRPLLGDSRSRSFGSSPAGLVVGDSYAEVPGESRAVYWRKTVDGWQPRLWSDFQPASFELSLSMAQAVSDDGKYVAIAARDPEGNLQSILVGRINYGAADIASVDFIEIPNARQAAHISHSDGVVRVVGVGRTAGEAFYWAADSFFTSTAVSFSASGYVTASGVNGSGFIAGDFGETVSTRSGRVWDEFSLWHPQGTGVAALGTLGGPTSLSRSINEAGQVVGYSSTEQDGRAFIWENGLMQDLNGLAPTGKLILRSALKNNDSGQILIEAEEGRFGMPFVILTPAH